MISQAPFVLPSISSHLWRSHPSSLKNEGRYPSPQTPHIPIPSMCHRYRGHAIIVTSWAGGRRVPTGPEFTFFQCLTEQCNDGKRTWARSTRISYKVRLCICVRVNAELTKD